MRAITVFLISLCCFHGFGQVDDTVQLISAYNMVLTDNSKINQNNYFEQFPNTFEKFEAIFGNKNGISSPLINESLNYVNAFFKLDSVGAEKLMEKSIDISIGGKWDSDAVSFFQNDLRNLVFRDINFAYRILKFRNESEIVDFFYFFYCSIHLKHKEIPEKFDQLKTHDPKFYELITEGHKRALFNSGH